MIKLYNQKMEYLCPIELFKDLRITEELETGYKTAQFLASYSIQLQEEYKIEIDGYLYVIKEVNMERPQYYDVYCKPYFGTLQGRRIDTLTGYDMSFSKCMQEILEGTDWSYLPVEEIAGSFTVNIQNNTALGAINSLKQLYGVDIYFDTLNRVIKAWRNRGEYKQIFFINPLNVKDCKVQSNTYDLITRLIPIGKDLTTVNMINEGSLWVEDYSYTDEIIVGYYMDSKIDNADDLLKTAKAKLADVSHPRTSYTIKATNFCRPLAIGDSIKIVNKIKGTEEVQRVQKKVEIKGQPEESYYEFGAKVSFDNLYKEFQNGQKIVNEGVLRNLTEINKLA